MSNTLRTAVLVLMILLCQSLVYAQTGTIKGRVAELQNKENPISNAIVVILDSTFDFESDSVYKEVIIKEAITGEDGKYIIQALLPGKYMLRVSHLGYAIEVLPLRVNADSAREDTVYLRGAVEAICSENIRTFRARPNTSRPEKRTIVGVVRDKDINLPISKALLNIYYGDRYTPNIHRQGLYPCVYTDSLGQFTLINLKPMHYMIDVREDALYSFSRTEIDVVADSTYTINFFLSKKDSTK